MDLVVSTKIYKIGEGPNQSFMSRKHVIEALQNSLQVLTSIALANCQRLKLDYVDIVFSHRPDFETPLEETCRAFHTLVDQGKALYWATSEWPVEMIVEGKTRCL